MSNSSVGSIPWVRVLALLAVVAMTALPFVSCGPMKFQGHELLRNTPPSDSDLGIGSGPAPKSTSSDKKLFEGDNQWIWIAYAGGFGMAVIALFLGSRGKLSVLVGLLGLGAVIAFLVGFNNLLGSKGDSSSKGDEIFSSKLKPSLTLEIGAYLTLGAFAGIAAESFLRRRKT